MTDKEIHPERGDVIDVRIPARGRDVMLEEVIKPVRKLDCCKRQSDREDQREQRQNDKA
jgi:hypothetical protein